MYCIGVCIHLSVLIFYFGLYRNGFVVAVCFVTVPEHQNKNVQFHETNQNISSVCLKITLYHRTPYIGLYIVEGGGGSSAYYSTYITAAGYQSER
jgi:hypothetical protein